MKISRRLWKSTYGAVGAEFAIAVPLLLMFIFGIIDVGRLMWTWNRAEKATQMGARYAAVTDMASVGLASYDFFSGGIARGDPIPESSFGGATCTSTGCSCKTGATCPDVGALAPGFANTVAWMQKFMPGIQPANVEIEYSYSGIGYAGDPYGPDINPLITVRLVNMNFHPTLGYFWGLSISMPPFASTLSMEDGSGTISN